VDLIHNDGPVIRLLAKIPSENFPAHKNDAVSVEVARKFLDQVQKAYERRKMKKR